MKDGIKIERFCWCSVEKMFIKNNNAPFSPTLVVFRDAAAEERAVLLGHCGLHPVSSLALLPACRAHLHRVAVAKRLENGLGGKLPGFFQTRSHECALLADPCVSCAPAAAWPQSRAELHPFRRAVWQRDPCFGWFLHWIGADNLPQIPTEDLCGFGWASFLTWDKFRCYSKRVFPSPCTDEGFFCSPEGGNSFKRPWLSPRSMLRKEGTEGGVTAFKNLTSKHKVLARRGRQGSYRGKTAG